MIEAVSILALVVLHRVDGGEVLVNPAQVTTLRNMDGKLRQLQPYGRCAIDLADRKFVVVIESCAEVRRILEGAPQ